MNSQKKRCKNDIGCSLITLKKILASFFPTFVIWPICSWIDREKHYLQLTFCVKATTLQAHWKKNTFLGGGGEMALHLYKFVSHSLVDHSRCLMPRLGKIGLVMWNDEFPQCHYYERESHMAGILLIRHKTQINQSNNLEFHSHIPVDTLFEKICQW